MCAHLFPPRDPAPRCSPLSSSSLLLSPPDPTPSTRPTGLWRGTQGPPGASSAGHLIGRPFFRPGPGSSGGPGRVLPQCAQSSIIARSQYSNQVSKMVRGSRENGKCATTRPPLMPPPRFVPQCCTFNAQYAMGNTMPMANANAHEPIWWSHDAHAQSATRAPRPKKKKNSRRTLSHI